MLCKGRGIPDDQWTDRRFGTLPLARFPARSSQPERIHLCPCFAGLCDWRGGSDLQCQESLSSRAREGLVKWLPTRLYGDSFEDEADLGGPYVVLVAARGDTAERLGPQKKVRSLNQLSPIGEAF